MQKRHPKTECEDLEDCKSIKSCPKRHPKRCKRYAWGNCRFKNECAYDHQNPTINKDEKLLNDKIEVLEKVVRSLTRKDLSLEAEAEKRKKKVTIEFMEDLKKPEAFKVKDVENKAEIFKKKNCSGDESSSVHKNLNNQKKNMNKKDMEVEKESVIKEGWLYCTKCNYKCKKENILKKHMALKHEERQCKQCPKKLPTTFELLLHVSKQHCETAVEKPDLVVIQKENHPKNPKCQVCGKEFETPMKLTIHIEIEPNEEDSELNKVLHSTQKSGKDSKESGFVFQESMLDEYL